jgi:hypothetical protein
MFQDTAGTQPVTAAGQTVGLWKDKSNKGHNYTKSAIGPTLTSTGALYFYGSGCFMINSDSWGDAAGYDIFVVNKPLGPGDWRTLLRGASTDHPGIIENNTTSLGMYNNSSAFKQFGNLTLDGSATVLLYINIDSSRKYAGAINGGTLSSQTVPGNQDSQPFYALGAYQGGSQQWGEINEMIIVPNCTPLQRKQIEQYLISKWIYSNVTTGSATTFYYTGGDQTYTVPSGYNALNVYLWGAGGQGATDQVSSGYGGAGAMVQGRMSVTPGQTLTIIVGQGPSQAQNRTYGGGGKGATADGKWYGSAAGGRSAIQVTAGTDYVVAGGGGGYGFGAQGGAGGLLTGSDGAGTDGAGKGGTQTAGGAGGTTLSPPGSAGSLRNGGDPSTAPGYVGGGYCGGGGGGYYGGGGASGGGGGGGSSYTANLTLIAGQSVFGYVSSDQYTAPNTSSPYYVSGVAKGGYGSHPDSTGSGSAGGNGLVVIVPVKVAVPPLFTRPFQPIDIDGCQLWLDAADRKTTLGTSTITQWTDKSGNQRNLTPYSGSTLFSPGQYVQLNSSIMAVTSPVDLTNVTWFIVAASPNSYGDQPVFSALPSSGGGENYQSTNGFGFYMDGTTQYRVYGQYYNGAAITNSANIQDLCIVANTINSSGYMQTYFNGTLQSPTSSSSARTSPASGFTIGGEGYLGSLGTYTSSVKIYEIAVYSSVLTTSQRQQVEGYLAWKWFPNGWNSFTVASFFNVGTNSLTLSSAKLADILVVGGGGGGGNGGSYSGGGGAGGFIYQQNIFIPAGTYTIYVGAGGVSGTNGEDSYININGTYYRGYGGGHGGNGDRENGAVGGCGGGGGGYGGGGSGGYQGYGGGYDTGGGGGMGGPGGTAGSQTGGLGRSVSITGQPIVYSTGGRGGGSQEAAGTNGLGNGGGAFSSGGSGIVIVRYS